MNYPETSDSLLAAVRNSANQEAWSEFEQMYRPVIFRTARAKGMQHADAMDLVQQVLMSVAAAIPDFERRNDGTRFRNWLGKVTRNALLKALTRGGRELVSGDAAAEALIHAPAAADPETSALVDTEYRREIFQRAAVRVRADVKEATWLAFELSCLQEKSVEQTAALLGVSVGSVYAARSRIMRRLRDAANKLA